jgi:hypothetical protein
MNLLRQQRNRALPSALALMRAATLSLGAAGRRQRTPPLFQRDREAAQVEVGHQSDLLAAQLQHGTFLIGKHDASRAAP